jgi:hypothetical protein
MKEKKITLQEKTRALTDVSLGFISPYLNGKSIGVLIWINTGLKFRKSPESVFKIDWSYVASVMNTSTPNVSREVRNLVKRGVLKKIEAGSYIWDLEGMEKLINPKTEKVLQITKIEPEKIFIRPEGTATNEFGLLINEYGQIIT